MHVTDELRAYVDWFVAGAGLKEVEEDDDLIYPSCLWDVFEDEVAAACNQEKKAIPNFQELCISMLNDANKRLQEKHGQQYRFYEQDGMIFLKKDM